MSEYKGYALVASIAATAGVCLAVIVGIVVAAPEAAIEATDKSTAERKSPVATLVAELVETVRPATSTSVLVSATTTSTSTVEIPREAVETSSTSEAAAVPETAAATAAVWATTELSSDGVVKIVGSDEVGFLMLKESGVAELVWLNPVIRKPVVSTKFVDVAFHEPSGRFAALGSDDTLHVSSTSVRGEWDPGAETVKSNVVAVTFSELGEAMVLTRSGVVHTFVDEGPAGEALTGVNVSDGMTPVGVDGHFFVIEKDGTLHHLVGGRGAEQCGIVRDRVVPLEIRGGVATLSDGSEFSFSSCSERLTNASEPGQVVLRADGAQVGFVGDGVVAHQAAPGGVYELAQGRQSVVVSGTGSFVAYGPSGAELVTN